MSQRRPYHSWEPRWFTWGLAAAFVLYTGFVAGVVIATVR